MLTVIYTGELRPALRGCTGSAKKAPGHDDPGSPQFGLWIFHVGGDERDAVFVRRQDFELIGRRQKKTKA